MTRTSRLSTTAEDLARALHALGDALAKASPEAVAETETSIDATVCAFRHAAEEAVAAGETLTPEAARAVTSALARCRRLGSSLALLLGAAAPADAPRAYTPVGRPLSPSDGASFLIARG